MDEKIDPLGIQRGMELWELSTSESAGYEGLCYYQAMADAREIDEVPSISIIVN